MDLYELKERRTYNSKTYLKPNGGLRTEFHVKPIHYLTQNNEWRDLSEITHYFGNHKIILKENWYEYPVHYGYLRWLIQRANLIKGGVSVGALKIPLLLNTTSTFFPDANPESTSVDGHVGNNPAGLSTWDEIRTDDLSGLYRNESSTTMEVLIEGGSSSTTFDDMRRLIFLFDTSALGNSDTINSATIKLWGNNVINDPNVGNGLDIVDSSPASNTTIAATDYSNVGTTLQSDSIALTAIVTGAYNTWTLTATGRGNISLTGVSKFGLRFDSDRTNNPDSGLSGGKVISVSVFTADETGTTKDPLLTVDHTSPATTTSSSTTSTSTSTTTSTSTSTSSSTTTTSTTSSSTSSTTTRFTLTSTSSTTTSSTTSSTTSTSTSTSTTSSSTSSSSSSTTTGFYTLKPELEILPITPILNIRRTYRSAD